MRLRLPRLTAVLFVLVALSGCLGMAPNRAPEPPPQPAAPPGVGESRLPPPAPTPAQPDLPELAGGPESTGRATNPPPAPHDPLRRLYLHGDLSRREIALTFDDGPDKVFTPGVLDALKAEKVPATFFLVGRRAEAFPEIVKRMVAEGHEIANHTWDHANLAKLEPDQIRADLVRTSAALERIAGRPVTLFRPPYGEAPPKVIEVAAGLNYRTIYWNVDSLDWKSLPAMQVSLNVLPHVRQGSIILQHSAGGVGEDLSGTVQALPLMIRTFKGQGYKFVTVSQILRQGR